MYFQTYYKDRQFPHSNKLQTDKRTTESATRKKVSKQVGHYGYLGSLVTSLHQF